MAKSITDLIAEQGYPPEVADAVLAHVKELKTEKKILAGESVLPTVQDAVHWHKYYRTDS